MANNVFQLKRSSVPSQAPLSTQLEIGELAVNLSDKILYTKDASNQVITLTSVPLDSVTNTSITYSASANSVKTAYDTAIAFSIALG
jgi:hypothetical protein